MATITSPRDQSPAGIARTASPSRGYSPSLTGTPSSSVRASLDLNRQDNKNVRSTSPAPQPGTQTQRRNRAALRDYYNLKSKAGADQLSRTGSVTSIVSTSDSNTPVQKNNHEDSSPLTAQLDEPSFDADKYISDLLRTSSLRDILRTESALVSEIRTLDGERKALVYDNYSKLIKAVGTIGEMQKGMRKGESRDNIYSNIRVGVVPGTRANEGSLDDVEKLESTLARLSETVKGLGPVETREGNGVEAKQRRENKKQKDLVRWVMNAPERLQEYLEHGETKKAEEEYETVKKLLTKWNGVKGVNEVRAACEKAMNEAQSEEDDEDNDEG